MKIYQKWKFLAQDGSENYLFARGMSSPSVKRVFSSVKSIVNLAIRERGLTVTNVFSGTFIPDDVAKQRGNPIPSDVLQRVQLECQNIDDEARWLISLLNDTGMRLSEVCELLTSHIHFDAATPFVDLVEHPWCSLKTTSSQRRFPLVGFSLWPAKKIASSHSV